MKVNGRGMDCDQGEANGDRVCHGYRDCLGLISEGKYEEAARIIAEIWPVDSRYAKALEDKLEVSRRWQEAKANEAERERFWEWMDSRR